MTTDPLNATFLAARDRSKRGGPDARVCGARTRQGGTCQGLPIREGKGRCLRHAGPDAARAHRERQFRGLQTGRVSAEAWNRAEARRAANRLTRAWRRDPWVPGRTIDLGDHEQDLQTDLAGRGLPYDLRTLAPAVADWLRWKWRRTRVDRSDEARWERILRQDLPARVSAAGPPPGGVGEGAAGRQPGTGAAVWALGVGPEPATSKRRRPDLPRAPRVVRGQGYRSPGRPRMAVPADTELADLLAIYRENRALAGPMLAACRTPEDEMALLRALADFARAPHDPAALRRWMDVVARFRRS